MLPVADGTIRSERFAPFIHPTHVTGVARVRWWHAAGISVALLAVMPNESVCRCPRPWDKDGRSVPYFFPQRYLTKQQQHDYPSYDKPEAPPRQTLLREHTVTQSVV